MELLNLSIFLLGVINLLRMSILTSLTFMYERYVLKNSIKKIGYNQNTSGKYKYRPLISVVIAAYNEEKAIQRTLRTLFESTYKKFEVVVVNDGSKDKTEKKIFEFIKNNPDKKITYVYQTNQGKAHALNNAIKNHIKGRIVMCLDADSILRNDAMQNALPYFRNRNTKALATNVKILSNNTWMSIIQKVEYIMGYHLKKSLTVGNIEYIIGGIGSMFRTSLLKKVGYYDTDTITEDIDLTMKIVALGNIKNRLIYAEDVVTYTESTLTLDALFRQRFRWKFGRFQTFWKNRDMFFNNNRKYTKFLTYVYLPFQLFSELTFLFDPIFILYIFILSLITLSPSSYFGIFLFMMLFTVIAVATDEETTTKDQLKLLALSPLAYIMFFVVSVVEYAGLIKCIIKWKEIVYADQYNTCSWTPVARLGGE